MQSPVHGEEHWAPVSTWGCPPGKQLGRRRPGGPDSCHDEYSLVPLFIGFGQRLFSSQLMSFCLLPTLCCPDYSTPPVLSLYWRRAGAITPKAWPLPAAISPGAGTGAGLPVHPETSPVGGVWHCLPSCLKSPYCTGSRSCSPGAPRAEGDLRGSSLGSTTFPNPTLITPAAQTLGLTNTVQHRCPENTGQRHWA